LKLTIIIPCFNEINTLLKIINKIKKQKIKKQIILVDDHSKDGTRELIKNKLTKKIDKIIFHKKNYGKGQCIISAKKFIHGNIVLIQDADLEYYPSDYQKIIKPIINGNAKVVYGSRVLNKNRYHAHNFTSAFRIFANHILSIISNIINLQNVSDAHTCYKAFDAKIFKKIILKEKGFSFCPEITSKVSNLGIKIHEVPIKYNGRSYKKGKKIKISDGVSAIITLIKYGLLKI
jgi:glycosyltransferase involved in cell wall biosynthesis